MAIIDRVLVGTLTVGVWVMIALQLVNTGTANAISVTEIYNLNGTIESIVESCSVVVYGVSGDVYVYDISDGEGYGNFSSGQGDGHITC